MSENGSCLKSLWLWGGPSIVVPLIMALTATVWPVGVLISIAFLVMMGRTFAEDTGRWPGDETRSRTGIVVLYVVGQIIWIPLLLFGVLWGICALNGGVRF